MKALTITQLSKTYSGGTVALKNIDFSVEEGDFFALLGPNGAGKSTTIGIITSLINKTAGQVKIFDCDIDEDFARAKTYIGVVPQEFNFNIFESPWQILVNQAGYYGLDRSTAAENAEYYLKKLELWDKRSAQSMRLSGGMKRRLMIARALVHKPKLLILDEPTAGVDVEIRHAMWDFLNQLNASGTTVILTTHYLEEAERLCKNIAIINHGKIVENTSMSELLSKLNVETFVLNLKKALTFAPELQGFKSHLMDEHTLSVDVLKEQSLNDLFLALNEQGIQVLSLRNKANRLEELFLGMISQPEEIVYE